MYVENILEDKYNNINAAGRFQFCYHFPEHLS